MTAYDIIMKKRRGGELSGDEICWFTEGYVKGDIPDYQMSALLMAICFNSMTAAETGALTMAMMNSGDVYSPSRELGSICVDKHSTGGVGDKTTLICGPICAACGVYVPKMSGRGLGHTGGTIDKMEAIPGFRSSLDYNEFINVLKAARFADVGQSDRLVPADKKIYDLRNATGTVDSIPLIASSIMSKKLALGADAIVLDVKTGDGAFMKSIEDSRRLAEEMLSIASYAERKCTALITDMDKPLGRAVGNNVEVAEAAEALKGNAPNDLMEVSLALAAQMLRLGGKGTDEECRRLAENAVSSGKALDALKKTVELQGGDPNALEEHSLMGVPRYRREVIADRDGYISRISCEKTGLLSLELGAGRHFKGEELDMTAGIIFDVTRGSRVLRGERLGTLMTSREISLDKAEKSFMELFEYSEEKPEERPAVMEIIKQ